MDEANDWQAALSHGRAREALTLYLSLDTPDADIREDLRSLVKLREALREKAWGKAAGYIPNLSSKLELDTAALERDLTLLEQAGKALEKHRPDSATSLSDITSPLLLGEAYTLLGTAAIYDNDLDEAKRYFELALENDPQHYRAHTNLGNLALESGDTDAAIAAYQKALKLNDQFANAHHNLGVAYRRKGQLNKSVRALRKAQNTSQRQLREDARESLKDINPRLKRNLKWLLYGVVAVVVYFILRRQGVL